MFRRKFGPRFRRRTFGGRRRFVRRRFSLAHKKFDWVTLFDTLSTGAGAQGCGWQVTTPCGFTTGDCGVPSPGPPVVSGCCNTITTVELMSQATLQSFYQDRVTIVRLNGDLYYTELVNLAVGAQRCLQSTGGATFLDDEQYALRYALQVDWGIRKDHASDDPSNVDVVSPGDIFDRTESYWYMRRNRLWIPRRTWTRTSLLQGSPIGICSNTSQAGYVVPAEASGSQPTYNVPAESTTCTEVDMPVDEACGTGWRSFTHPVPPLMHWRIRSKRHIVMRRDDRLHLQFQVNHPPRPGFDTGFNCNPTFLNEGWNGEFQIRIDALVQLN